MIDLLPPDSLNKIAEWLPPKDISYFASCDKSLSEILPVNPLRIRIVTSDQKNVLDRLFFVSDEGGNTLRYKEHLQFGKKYRLWLYDELRCNRVDLVRQIPLGDGFDITLQPQQRLEGDFCPMQLWDVSHSDTASNKGDLIEWDTEVGLSVGGDQKEPRRASSTERKLLSFSLKSDESKPSFDIAQWHSTTDKWGPNEKMILMRADFGVRSSSPNSKWKTFKHFPNSILSNLGKSKKDEIAKTSLEFRAPRVLHDDRGLIGYYSLRSLKAGIINFERYHATVEFELWTDDGYMVMKSKSLNYSLAIPMIIDSKYDPISNEPKVLEVYYNIKYQYTWAGKFYLAASADAEVDMNNATTLRQFAAKAKVEGKLDVANNQFILGCNEREEIGTLEKNVSFPRDPSVFFYCVLSSNRCK